MNLSVPQAIIAVVSIIGVVVLGADHVIGGDAVVAFLSLVTGGSLGYVNGKKVATKDASFVAAAVASEHVAKLISQHTADTTVPRNPQA